METISIKSEADRPLSSESDVELVRRSNKSGADRSLSSESDVELVRFLSKSGSARPLSSRTGPNFYQKQDRPQSDESEDHFSTDMRVEAIESNGFDKHVTFRYNERGITGRLPAHSAFEPVVGEMMRVSMDLFHISIFDEKSGLRI